MESIKDELKKHFGFDDFRPGQEEVMTRVLNGRHTLAVLPTGSGKSLCYQLPALMLPGVTLVMSPLIALMQDQVEALQARGISSVTFINSSLSSGEVYSRYERIRKGEFKLVYVAPERCDSPRFQDLIRTTDLSMLVIDEAHCISHWGHDFRPHYRTISKRLPELKKATVLALTATATPEVRKDIAATLAMPQMGLVIGDFNRPNLRLEAFSVQNRDDKDLLLLNLLKQDSGACIIYTSTRKEARETFDLLNASGLTARLYHAGLKNTDRADAQRAFLQGNCRIIVATVAFGMGIDKPDIRRVIHYNLPGSPERYYQEAGRAGRDGQPAICTLLYSPSDVRILHFFMDQSYPNPGMIQSLYTILREEYSDGAHPAEIAKATEVPELGVNAALHILYEQGCVQITSDGRYVVTHADQKVPKLDLRDFHQRRSRDEARLNQMMTYTGRSSCRRGQILRYFGQNFQPPCGNCDYCDPRSNSQTTPAEPATADSDRIARIILLAAMEFQGRWGRTMVGDVLLGSKRKKLLQSRLDQMEAYGRLSLYTGAQISAWMEHCVQQNLLHVTAEEYPRLLLTNSGKQALAGDVLLSLPGFLRRSKPELPARKEPRALADHRPRHNDLRVAIEKHRMGGSPADPALLLGALSRAAELHASDVALAITALAQDSPDAKGPIAPFLRSTDASVIAAACEALAKLNAREHIQQILPLMQHASSTVRRSAARAVGMLRVREARDSLRQLSEQDSSDSVRVTATAALQLLD